MAKDKISDYSSTANSNTDIAGINIDEGCAPSGINDAIRTLMAQLKTWQSGGQDVYIHPAGSASAPSITANGDTNTGIFFPAADTVGITTGGTERARVDSSGNLLVGTTTAVSGAKVTVSGSVAASAGASVAGNAWGVLPYTASSLVVDTNAGTSRLFSIGSDASTKGAILFYQSTSSGSATQAMTLDASGNLGVGTTSPSVNLEIGSNSSTVRALAVRYSSLPAYLSNSFDGSVGLSTLSSNTYNTSNGSSSWSSFQNTSYGAAAVQVVSGTYGGDVRFLTAAAQNTNPSERARIDSSGNYMVNTTNLASVVGSSPVGSIGNFAATAGTNSAAFVHTHSSNPYGPFIYFNGSSPNNTSNYFLSCNDTTNQKAAIYSSGTFGSRTSTYGGISDIKVKQDIVDASSQWNDIKALRFRKYRFKDDPTGPLQLGLISQEAELVSPGLVFETPDTTMDEEGNRVETGEVTKSVKYSILYMKAMVALQEAMNRIEQLEADVAALKG